jgi:hypothetical protein
MFFLLIAVAVVTAVPILAAVLVTAASLREDYDQSLAGRPPGPFTATARWLLRARVGSAAGRPRRRVHRTQWVPRPRQAADDYPDRAGPDGEDGVHPGGAEHTGTVPRG